MPRFPKGPHNSGQRAENRGSEAKRNPVKLWERLGDLVRPERFELPT